jgi:ankyrin repeat protein
MEPKVKIDFHDIMCPISKSIFLDPVIASDGFTYERNEINKWIISKPKPISPMTGDPIEKYLVSNKLIMNTVKEFLRQNPEFKSQQYKNITIDDDCGQKGNREIIKNIIRNKKFNLLLQYGKFHLDHDNFINLFINCESDKVHMHVLDNIVDLNVKTRRGYLFETIFRCCNILIKKYFCQKQNVDINLRNQQGCTILHYACTYSTCEIVQLLLDRGCNVNDQTSDRNAYYPLVYACDNLNVQEGMKIIRLLIQNGAKIDIPFRHHYTISFFLICCSKYNVKLIKFLFEKGINAFHTDTKGDGALHYAAMNSDVSVIRYLVELGFDPNVENNSGKKPIEFALNKGYTKVIYYLLHLENCRRTKWTEHIKMFYYRWVWCDLVDNNKNLSEDDKLSIKTEI